MLLVAAFLAVTAPAEGAELEVDIPSTGLGRVISQPSGIDCPTTCSATFPDDSVVSLTALPSPGYVFGLPHEDGYPADQSGWGGDDCEPAQADPLVCSIQVAATGAIVDAFFRPAALLLLVPNGAGPDDEVVARITSPQTGEEEERVCSSDPEGGVVCTFAYLPGRAVALTPSPLAAPFPVWSDDDCRDVMPCTVVLDEPRRSITATFATQRVSVRIHGPGRVVSTPPGIDCTDADDECFAEFPTGQDVAIAADGAAPTWVTNSTAPTRAGCDSVSGTVCHVIAERARWAVVSFAGVPPDEQYPPRIAARLRIRKTGGGSGTVSGGGIDCGSRCAVERDYGDRVELVAGGAAGSRFVRWRRGCGERARCAVTVGPITRMTAEFEAVATSTSTAIETRPAPAKLRATLDRVRVRRVGRRRFRIVLPLHVNAAATVTARVMKRGRRVFSRTWRVGVGDRRLTVHMRARRGRYRLVLTVRGTDGQVARITRTLRLRR